MTPISTSFIETLKFDKDGLIPAIAQDWLDGAILMLAWMNRESLNKTILSGEIHYWSRSRNEIWHKGATSGHFQKLKEIRYDCDSDAILLKIEQIGGISCHTGTRSCFFQEAIEVKSNSIIKDNKTEPSSNVCSELFQVIEKRHLFPEPDSYTNKLLMGGDNTILKKIGEESAEFIMACKDDDPKSISNEAADLIFHLQVALEKHHVKWKEVLEILQKRQGAPRRE